MLSTLHQNIGSRHLANKNIGSNLLANAAKTRAQPLSVRSCRRSWTTILPSKTSLMSGFLVLLISMSTIEAAARRNSESRKVQQYRQKKTKNDHVLIRPDSDLYSKVSASWLSQSNDPYTVHYYMNHACERRTLKLSCPKAGDVISIVRANFGRHSFTQCPDVARKRNMVCVGSFAKPKKVVSKRCSGHKHCEVPVLHHLLGNPCPHVSIYLEVYYACVNNGNEDDEPETKF